jgi:outer membrane receptor protein involved in Fe transport
MQNEKRPIEFYGGIKGTLSKRISFNAGISFANVRDKALFITDTTYSIRNKFDVIYDTMNVTTIDASISYQLQEKLKVDVLGKFNSYSALNNSYAWNLPRLEFLVRGSYNLFDKFLFNLDLTLEEGRKALVYEMGDDVTIENGQYIKSLDFITDLNLSIEYRYNKRISAFVEFNNIASQRYKRWYNTPVHSFQFLGGVTFRF